MAANRLIPLLALLAVAAAAPKFPTNIVDIPNNGNRASHIFLTDTSGAIRASIPTNMQFFLCIVTNADPARGPMVISMSAPAFGNQTDPVMIVGYNLAGDGNLIKPNQPGMGMFFEGNFNDGSSSNKMELYAAAHFTSGRMTRPLFYSFNNALSNIHTATFKGNVIDFLADDADNEGGSQMLNIQPNNFTMYAPLNAQTSFQMKAAAGQSAVFAQGFNGVDSVFVFGPDSSQSAFFQLGSVVPMHIWNNPGGLGAGSSISVGVQDNSAAGVFQNDAHVLIKALVARGKIGQVANIFEVQNSNTTMVAVSPLGFTGIGTSAPIATLHLQHQGSNGVSAISGITNCGPPVDAVTVAGWEPVTMNGTNFFRPLFK